MGLGADLPPAVSSLVPQDKSMRYTGLLAAATWAGGMVMGSNTAKNIGIGGLLAVVYIQVLRKRYAPPAEAPSSVQGWG
jgi:hypothetical protein